MMMPASAGGAPLRYSAVRLAKRSRKPGRSRIVNGAVRKNAAAAPPMDASMQVIREGRADGVIQHATSGINNASPPLYFTAAESPAIAPAIAKLRITGRSCADSAISIVNATKKVSGTSVRT